MEYAPLTSQVSEIGLSESVGSNSPARSLPDLIAHMSGVESRIWGANDDEVSGCVCHCAGNHWALLRYQLFRLR